MFPDEPKRETGEKPTSRSTAPTEKAGKQLACRQTIQEAREKIWLPNSAITYYFSLSLVRDYEYCSLEAGHTKGQNEDILSSHLPVSLSGSVTCVSVCLSQSLSESEP